jgi:hypothetical protein
MIPITDLLAAGFQPKMRAADTEPVQSDPDISVVDREQTERVSQLEHENEVLRVRLESEQQLRAMAEQSATDLRMSLRMLETAPTPPPAPVEPDPPPKRRWWHF